MGTKSRVTAPTAGYSTSSSIAGGGTAQCSICFRVSNLMGCDVQSEAQRLSLRPPDYSCGLGSFAAIAKSTSPRMGLAPGREVDLVATGVIVIVRRRKAGICITFRYAYFSILDHFHFHIFPDGLSEYLSLSPRERLYVQRD